MQDVLANHFPKHFKRMEEKIEGEMRAKVRIARTEVREEAVKQWRRKRAVAVPLHFPPFSARLKLNAKDELTAANWAEAVDDEGAVCWVEQTSGKKTSSKLRANLMWVEVPGGGFVRENRVKKLFRGKRVKVARRVGADGGKTTITALTDDGTCGMYLNDDSGVRESSVTYCGWGATYLRFSA